MRAPGTRLAVALVDERTVDPPLSRQNVVPLIEVIQNVLECHLVMQYFAHGDLLDFMKRSGKLSEARPAARPAPLLIHIQDDTRRIFRDLIMAVEFIHRQGFVHRDLKCENVLLADPTAERVVVADFGFAGPWSRGVLQVPELLPGSAGFAHLLAQDISLGSMHYAAPEICEGRTYEGPEVDMWSLGVVRGISPIRLGTGLTLLSGQILYIIVTGCMPFSAPNEQELSRRICTASYSVPKYVSARTENASFFSGRFCLTSDGDNFQSLGLRPAPDSARPQPAPISSARCSSRTAASAPTCRP